MMRCSVCNKKINPFALWFIRGITWCSCGTELRLKYWLFWVIFDILFVIGSVFAGVWLMDKFNIQGVTVFLLYLLLLFIVPSLIVYSFATLIKNEDIEGQTGKRKTRFRTIKIFDFTQNEIYGFWFLAVLIGRFLFKEHSFSDDQKILFGLIPLGIAFLISLLNESPESRKK
jgi:hypothetical protein